MMYKRIFLSLFLAFTFSLNWAQVDEEANKILDKLAAKADSYDKYKVEFTYRIFNKPAGIDKKYDGELLLDDDKYRLNVKDNIIISTGDTIYTYNKDTKEVQVTLAKELSKDAISPENIFTIYQTGFKTRLRERTKVDGKNVAVIDLYPFEPGSKDYSIVRLTVNTDEYEFVRALIKAKNGSYYIYKVANIDTDIAFESNAFKFTKKEFPNAVIIDF